MVMGFSRPAPLILAVAFVLMALAGATTPARALANPASVFCAQSGGKSEILTNAAGAQFGICILPGGQIVEEWAYYRAHARPPAAPPGK